MAQSRLFLAPTLVQKSGDCPRGRKHKFLDRGKRFEYYPVVDNPGDSETR